MLMHVLKNTILPSEDNRRLMKAQASWFGIDPSFSSSQFAICVVQWRDDKLECGSY